MADLGGAVLGFAVSKLLDQVLVALKHVKNAPRNLLKLQNLLERLQQSVDQLCSSVQGKTHPADKWFTDLHKELQRSRDLVNVAGGIQRNIVKRYSTSKGSLEVYANIQALLQEASVHQWASGISNPIIFSDTDAKMLADIKTTLERVEGLHKIANLSSKGSDILSATAKLEQVFSSESSGEPSSLEPFSSMRSANECSVGNTCYVPKPRVTFGGEDVADKLINHLLDEVCKKWVGLWGMGGIGKTFTARKVFHDSRIQSYFSGGIFWLTVSKDHADPKHLLKQLYETIDGRTSLSHFPNNLEDAKSYLRSRLDQERVLLVLDDVWRDEMLDNLDVISESKKGVILVTTRDQGILRKVIHFTDIFEVPRLSLEDSWKLFCFYAFRGSGGVVPLELDAVAKKMVEECRQLPLALEVIGSTMADRELVPAEKASGQTAFRVWERALVQLKDANSAKNEYDALYLKLQLSVESLSEYDSRLQDCFFYFAAFPEDAKINIEYLVRMWVAEGLVQGDVTSFLSAEEEGRVLLGSLAAKAMIELLEDRDQCRIHDVLRALALCNLNWNFSKGVEIEAFARQCLYAPGLHADELPKEWMVSATLSSAKRLSLKSTYLKRFPEPEQFDAPHLQVLLLSDNWNLESLCPRFFGKLSKLKVLDLSFTGIKRMPKKLLRGLKSLVLLDLSYCLQLEEVSDYINRLQNLEFLELFGCSRLQKLPLVNKLTKLKTYRACVLGEEEGMDVRDRSGPGQSCTPWRMHRGLQNGVIPYVLPPNLRQLQFYCIKFSPKCPLDMSSLGLLEELRLHGSWRPHNYDNEERPSVKDSKQSVLADIDVTQNYQLKVLEIPSGFAKRMESLGEEGAFPSLKSLLISCDETMEKMFIFHPGTLPKIEYLALDMSRREHLPTSIVQLRSLKRLQLLFSGEITMDESIEFAADIFKQPDCFPHLEHLGLYDGKGLLKSHILPEHILDRQQQGLLIIDIAKVG